MPQLHHGTHTLEGMAARVALHVLLSALFMCCLRARVQTVAADPQGGAAPIPTSTPLITFAPLRKYTDRARVFYGNRDATPVSTLFHWIPECWSHLSNILDVSCFLFRAHAVYLFESFLFDMREHFRKWVKWRDRGKNQPDMAPGETPPGFGANDGFCEARASSLTVAVSSRCTSCDS